MHTNVAIRFQLSPVVPGLRMCKMRICGLLTIHTHTHTLLLHAHTHTTVTRTSNEKSSSLSVVVHTNTHTFVGEGFLALSLSLSFSHSLTFVTAAHVCTYTKAKRRLMWKGKIEQHTLKNQYLLKRLTFTIQLY